MPLSWLLPRLRGTLQEAAREVDNVRTLLAPSAVEDALSSAQSPSGAATFPSWRAERIREHLRTITYNLNMVESGLSDPAMQLNMDVIALRQAAGDVRRQANEFSRTLDVQEARAGAELTQSSSPSISATAASDPLVAMASAATRTLPSDAPPELFLLSSPQGPVGVLFDQRGTYTTAPFTTSLSSSAFIEQFNQNRQLIASLGQQIVQSSHNLHNQLGSAQPTPTQQPGQAHAEQPHLNDAAAQQVIQNIIQNREERQAANAPPDAPAENERVVNVAGHLWLIFKLACFVYIFAGGGGWYRPLMLGSIAIIVYIVQLGVFEQQFNNLRRHFEALLPNPERVAQGHGGVPDQPNAAEPRRNVTPEEAARRLLLQQRNNQFGWVREGLSTLERGLAIFVASLWPGVGERMVHAQEERERLERVAASEERERQEEERRAREEAEKDSQATAEASLKDGAVEKPPLERNATQTLSDDFMEPAPSEQAASAQGGSAKGKEKAAYVDDGETAGSSS